MFHIHQQNIPFCHDMLGLKLEMKSTQKFIKQKKSLCGDSKKFSFTQTQMVAKMATLCKQYTGDWNHVGCSPYFFF